MGRCHLNTERCLFVQGYLMQPLLKFVLIFTRKNRLTHILSIEDHCLPSLLVGNTPRLSCTYLPWKNDLAYSQANGLLISWTTRRQDDLHLSASEPNGFRMRRIDELEGA